MAIGIVAIIDMKQLLQLMNSKAKLQQYVPEMELQVSLMSVLIVVFKVRSLSCGKDLWAKVRDLALSQE